LAQLEDVIQRRIDANRGRAGRGRICLPMASTRSRRGAHGEVEADDRAEDLEVELGMRAPEPAAASAQARTSAGARRASDKRQAEKLTEKA